MRNLLRDLPRKGGVKYVPQAVPVLMLLLTTCCISSSPPQENTTSTAESGKITVFVTLLPQAEFAKSIGGDRVEVYVMVPPGADPHTYEPKPSQLEALSVAKMYAKVGSGIDFETGWMDKITALNRDMYVVDCSKGINLTTSQDSEEPGIDTHIWNSVRNAEVMTEDIYEGLVKVDPEDGDFFEKNKEEYIRKLIGLDGQINQTLSGDVKKKFIVYHPAWAYFARDYGLEQIPIEQGGKEPSAKWMSDVIQAAEDNNITVVFASPEYSTRSAEIIANEIHGTVVLINEVPVDYIDNMRSVAEAFAAA